jgi:hypothetical protein
MKNSVAQANGKMVTYCRTQEYAIISCSTIIDLTATDVIELGFAKNTINIVDLSIYYVYFTITKV